MKITKRQLRKIIKEERARLIGEAKSTGPVDPPDWMAKKFELAEWDPMGAEMLDEGDGTWLIVPSDEWRMQDGRQSALKKHVKATLRNSGWRIVDSSQGMVTIKPMGG